MTMKLRTGLTTGLCICAGLGIMTSPVWFSSYMHDSPSAKSPSHASACANGYYALTFDDGPFPGHTENLVATLKKLHVRATFFNVGQRAKKYPNLVKLERTVGEVENHSWNHKNYTKFKTTAAIVRNIRKTQKAIGGDAKFMRPPYGGTNAKVRAAIRKTGMIETMWTIDTDDWEPPHTHRKLIKRAARVERGGIILMHDGWPYVIYTLPALIDNMKKNQMCSGKLEETVKASPSMMPGRYNTIYTNYPFLVKAGKP
jgi:peptidoglycan-N-acetylglucosamine deacetylase